MHQKSWRRGALCRIADWKSARPEKLGRDRDFDRVAECLFNSSTLHLFNRPENKKTGCRPMTAAGLKTNKSD